LNVVETVYQSEQPMTSLFARFAKDQSGATAIEYGFLAALVAVVCITTLQLVGAKLNNRLTHLD
jgi:pilus assembly protein Flp/PilA